MRAQEPRGAGTRAPPSPAPEAARGAARAPGVTAPPSSQGGAGPRPPASGRGPAPSARTLDARAKPRPAPPAARRPAVGGGARRLFLTPRVPACPRTREGEGEGRREGGRCSHTRVQEGGWGRGPALARAPPPPPPPRAVRICTRSRGVLHEAPAGLAREATCPGLARGRTTVARALSCPPPPPRVTSGHASPHVTPPLFPRPSRPSLSLPPSQQQAPSRVPIGCRRHDVTAGRAGLLPWQRRGGRREGGGWGLQKVDLDPKRSR